MAAARWVATMLCLAALLAPAGAAADADPASDILLVQNVFYPYSPAVPLSMQRSLNREVARAKRAGFPIKVALIGRRIDLGGIPELFGKPSRYARFLDTEISFRTLQPVLVVTAAGLGGSGLGRSAMATLAALPRPASDQPGVLAETAIADVAKLAAAAGHPIAVEAPGARAAATGGPSAALLIGLAIALVVVALALVTVRDRRRPIR